MIKIIIERRIMPGLEPEYEQALRKTMRTSISAPGFIAAENLQEYHRPDHRLLITLWRDYSAWKQWQHSPERERAMQWILPLLTDEEHITAYEQV